MQKPRFILAFSWFLVSSLNLASQNNSELADVHEAYVQQKYQLALDGYQAHLSKDSSSMISLERGGLSAYKLGDLVKAKELLSALEARDSLHLVGLKTLAAIYEQQKNTPKAIKYYTRLTDLAKDDGYLQRKLGQQYRNAGLNRLAFEHFNKAYELNPRDMLALDGLAELTMLEKKYSAADSILWKGLEMDSMHIDFNLLMATSKFRQKAYDSTAYYMMRIRGKIDFRPHQSRMLGYAFMQLDSLDLAINYLSRAIMDEGTKEYAHYNLGVAYEKKLNTEYAIHHFNEALKAGISENVDLYHRNLARLYNRSENLKEAIPHYQDAYKYGEDPIVLFYLGRASDAYYADKDIAIRYYKKFINSGYDHEEYKTYAKDRARQLIELKHQQQR